VNGTMLAGRYALVEMIAAGGMGTVHKATDERLGRTVAVKILRADLAGDPRFVERFRREARAVAALSHPNIAGVYDYGEEDDQYFFVMEFVDGSDLSQIMRVESPLSQERSALIAAGTLDALQHAHSAGVVHRDIKPANIMVTKRERSTSSTGSHEKVKVTDFGIARAVGDATLTATGSMLGTAHYLSPEQASGGNVGPATDQYSTGIVLYEMLVGTVPFTGDSPVAIAMRHMADELPPPSTVNPGISLGFDEIVRRATSKDASDRFPDAQAMADALRNEIGSSSGGRPVAAGATAAIGGSPTAVLEATSQGTAERPLAGEWDAHRVGRIVLLSFAALIVVAIALLVFRLAAGDEEPQRAERQRGGAVGQSAEEEPAPTEVVIPEDILGRPFDDVAAELSDELGLIVDRNDEPSNDFPTAGVVSGAVPAPGSTVTEGATVTLIVSTGPEDDDEDKGEEDKDEGDEGGPPPGKGPGEEKPRKQPKDDD
jgi:eukaryotic-like serine/threonine-protein kinase